ncbi:hypothetical protein A2U01_0062843, partial [Trifolium medium]|nr:hypothetical protein [Trifolium medium]
SRFTNQRGMNKTSFKSWEICQVQTIRRKNTAGTEMVDGDSGGIERKKMQR